MKSELTVSLLCEEANQFARIESSREHASLFGVTDGKAIGTYVEHKFRDYLSQRYSFTKGSSARGIDFPDLAVDMKVTSIRQPQSSCPFQSARQKIFGLETVLKLILPLLSYALLPCHSERSAAESKNLLPTQVEKMLRLRSA